MKIKLNSYQKQKQRIKELEKDIYYLVVNKNTEEGVLTKLKYEIIFEIDEISMKGN